MIVTTERIPQTAASPEKRSQIGTHLLADFWGVRELSSRTRLEAVLATASQLANSVPVQAVIREFEGQGLSGVILLEESHISIHTWPEIEYVGVDIFTCGSETTPHKALEYLQEVFQPEDAQFLEVRRGTRRGADRA